MGGSGLGSQAGGRDGTPAPPLVAGSTGVQWSGV
jgi:hypothetical protein